MSHFFESMLEMGLQFFQEGGHLSEIHLAAYSGNVQKVRSLIQSGAEMNKKEMPLNLTPLYSAISGGNLRIIEMMVQAGADLNVTDADQVNPLVCAVCLGNLSVVKCLVDLGANIQTRVSDHKSALHVAAESGHAKIVKFFIQKGLDVNIRDDQEETPLHAAAKIGRIEVVKVLLANGADINAGASTVFKLEDDDEDEDEDVQVGTNVTPIFLAANGGHTVIVDFLIKAGANVNMKTSQMYTPLHPAAQHGPLELVNLLLKANCNVNVKTLLGRSPLFYAARSGQVKIVERLLKVEGIEVNPVADSNETPLMMAVGYGYLPIVKLLVERGAPINGRVLKTMTPLLLSIKRGKENVADWLLRNGADVRVTDCCDLTPLHYGCIKGLSLKMIKALISKGLSVNVKSHEGVAPIHHAAQMDRIEIVKYLVNQGANPDDRCKRRFTALHYAAQDGSIKSIKYLVSKAEVNATAGFQETPLHLAVDGGYKEIVKILLENGANSNALKGSRETPLHTAAEKGHHEITELLLKHGADPNLKEILKGQTPLFLAVKNEHQNVVRALVDKGADVNSGDKLGVLPIHVAVDAVNRDIVKALLSKGAYYNAEAQAGSYSGLPLESAHKSGNAKLILLLELTKKLFGAVIKNDTYQIGCCVQAGAIVNAKNANGRTALHLAVSNGNLKAVSALLEQGANLTQTTNKGNHPLHLATAAGDSKMMKALLTHARKLSCVECSLVINAATTEGKTTSLHIAANKNNFYAVKLLVKNGAIYNATNRMGKTPLQLSTDRDIKVFLRSAEQLFEAVKKEDRLEEVMGILTCHGSVINASDSEGGGTALYWAVSKGLTDLALALLKAGADYFLVTNKGTSPLHIAASKGNCEVVGALIHRIKSEDPTKVADFINACTVKGSTALHVALNANVVAYLLREGAMYNVQNGQGKTAEELTTNDDVRKLLKTTHQLFDLVKKGASQVMKILDSLKVEEFKAVMGVRNEEGQSLHQIASAGTNKKLIKLLEKSKRIC